MIGARTIANWETLVAFVVAVVVVGFVVAVWLSRSPRDHHVRFGVFLERGDGESDDDDEKGER